MLLNSRSLIVLAQDGCTALNVSSVFVGVLVFGPSEHRCRGACLFRFAACHVCSSKRGTRQHKLMESMIFLSFVAYWLNTVTLLYTFSIDKDRC